MNNPSSGNLSLLKEFRLLYRNYKRSLDEQVKFDYMEFQKFLERIAQQFGIEYKGLEVLEIGCGQRYPHALILSKENDVTAIDLDVILTGWSPTLLYKLFTKCGYRRGFKTVIRKVLFDNKYHCGLSRLAEGELKRKPAVYQMNAEKLNFPDSKFDFIFSIAVLEHITDVEVSIREIQRVLKVGGIFGLQINLFTGLTGGHNIYGIDGLDMIGMSEEKLIVPPWDHLRKRQFGSISPLNKLRIADYKEIFGKYFSEIYYHETLHDDHRRYFNHELRKELSDYSDNELLCDDFQVIGRKETA
ncbi:MAG: methyltransferase domain-containing protein [candidate division Zixibacteria bacterium]|nr:methyltransferase domain-containing protein [candidate division Zixibacteria bacterium]